MTARERLVETVRESLTAPVPRALHEEPDYVAAIVDALLAHPEDLIEALGMEDAGTGTEHQYWRTRFPRGSGGDTMTTPDAESVPPGAYGLWADDDDVIGLTVALTQPQGWPIIRTDPPIMDAFDEYAVGQFIAACLSNAKAVEAFLRGTE